jgi:hypothetical protein
MAEKKRDTVNAFPFGKVNFRLLLIGIGILVIGYLLMIGGGSEDPTVFNEDELFSPRRITVAPLVILGGYAFIFYAILKKHDEA